MHSSYCRLDDGHYDGVLQVSGRKNVWPKETKCTNSLKAHQFTLKNNLMMVTEPALAAHEMQLIVPYYHEAVLLVVLRVSQMRMGARAFCYQDSLLWNHLPVSVQEADTLSTFKSRLKNYI